MITIEEFEQMLDEIALEFPSEFYNDLNGGIVLQPEARLHDDSREDDFYILGEYRQEGALGRYIVIYYGSFIRVFGRTSRSRLKNELRDTLKHEFTHHLESLSGERGLEIKDEHNLERYKNRYRHIKNKEE